MNTQEENIYEIIFSMQSGIKYFLGFIILSNFVLIFALRFQIRITNKVKSMFGIQSIQDDLKKIRSVLLIIAHPDDEIMFWSPTLKKLLALNIKVKVLCLSNGNYNGIGDIRTEEFKAVSKSMHMEDNVILNVPELQDDITKKWDAKVVSKKIDDFLKKNNDIDTILTFDENGVTKHPNHISCYDGLVYYLKANRKEVKEKKTQIYLLDTFNPISQYTIFIPFWTFFFKQNGYFSWNFLFSYQHMSIYKSQFNIMRRLHVLLSGYSYCNSYTKVVLQ